MMGGGGGGGGGGVIWVLELHSFNENVGGFLAVF
jgi:hypothetical protein